MTNEEILTIERDDFIKFLRGVCKEYGDNEWSDNLHLIDILEKHLLKYLL